MRARSSLKVASKRRTTLRTFRLLMHRVLLHRSAGDAASRVVSTRPGPANVGFARPARATVSMRVDARICGQGADCRDHAVVASRRDFDGIGSKHLHKPARALQSNARPAHSGSAGRKRAEKERSPGKQIGSRVSRTPVLAAREWMASDECDVPTRCQSALGNRFQRFLQRRRIDDR
jgi:hypothetical protein